mmetsp:Transcript_15465/g.37987  ORF Transcript_15465/g.37987 Transcript_15465/m.37987 type:complete len:279 (-) Transcript_15465:680-1516(-)
MSHNLQQGVVDLADSPELVRRVAVIQAGLLSTWLWESTIENLIKPNPFIQFDYYIVLQNNQTISRWSVDDEKHLETLEVEVKRFESAVGALGNAHIKYMSLVSNVSQNSRLADNMFYSVMGKYKCETFCKSSEIILLKEATKQVDLDVNYSLVIKLREDSAWYRNIVLDEYHFNDSSIHFLHCDLGWGGVSNKAWMGKMSTVIKFNYEIFAGMFQFTEPVHNMETYCAMILKHLGLTMTYNADTVYVSDARRRLDGTICFSSHYHCYDKAHHSVCGQS